MSGYEDLANEFGASRPLEPLESIVGRLTPPGAPAGTTDAFLGESRGSAGSHQPDREPPGDDR